MSHERNPQNEAPYGDASRDRSESGDSANRAAYVPRVGGFFSDVVWTEPREQHDSPGAGNTR